MDWQCSLALWASLFVEAWKNREMELKFQWVRCPTDAAIWGRRDPPPLASMGARLRTAMYMARRAPALLGRWTKCRTFN